MKGTIDFEREKMIFGRNVFRARESLGLSGTELGIRIGSDKSAVSKIENGERNPSFEMILKMADALETSPEELVKVSEEPPLTIWIQNLERKLSLLEPEVRCSAQKAIVAMIEGFLIGQGKNLSTS